VVFAAALLANAAAVFFGRADQPPKPGDGMDYESIAYNVAAGRGYGRALSDPEYQRPYLESDTPEAYQSWLDSGGDYTPTAYRPPGLSTLLAGVYKIFGRNFLAWRLVNCVIVALAVTLAAALAWRLAGSGVGTAVGVLGVLDPAVREYAGYFLAEGTVFLLMVCLAWLLVSIIRKRRLRDALLLGATLGVMILMKSLYVLWVPMLLVILAWCWTRRVEEGIQRKPLVAAAGVFLLAGLIVPSPWWVRNCVLLEAPMPMGTQGGIGLPGGFSDAALANGGLWVDADTFGVFDEINRELGAQNASPLEREIVRSRYGTGWVLTWMRDNPGKVVQLMGLKLLRLWTRGPTIQGLIMALLGLAGWRWMRRRPEVCVLWALVLCNSLTAMATYVTGGGRFMTPVLLILYILGAIGVWRMIEAKKKPGPTPGSTAGSTPSPTQPA
jgi:4-amino-4-deoxy-L-arabinose transferase-like glycosyltransferase